jgi:hypothetical protein
LDSKEIIRQAEAQRFEQGARMLALESLVIRLAAVLETTHLGALQFGIGVSPDAPEDAKALNEAVNRHLAQMIGHARTEVARDALPQSSTTTQ